jgi:hypothetical protein
VGSGAGPGDIGAADSANAASGATGSAPPADVTCRSSTITRERNLTARVIAMIANTRAMKSMINLDNVHFPVVRAEIRARRVPRL